jgi:hypothetical protein
MTRLALSLSVILLMAGPAQAAALTDTGLVVPESGFVFDGGDAEAASLAEGSCLDPAIAEEPSATTSAEPSLLASASALPDADSQAAPAPRARAFEYSDGYRTRLKIHKYASYATLPLFVAQYAVGQKLYNGNGSDSTRSLHGALAAGTAVLFAVNTVTGIWNLSEGRKDPNHRTKRMVHGLLMAVADAGFVASAVMTPHRQESDLGFETVGGTSPSTHRAIALTSMGVATVAYLMMLIH